MCIGLGCGDATSPARAGGKAAVGLSLIPQAHGGALLSGAKPGNPGHNQHTVRQRAQEIRGQLIGQLEGAVKDLSALLETARESDGDRLRCKACGSFIPGVSKLKLSDILAVIPELRAILPAQQEHEGLQPITVQVGGGWADCALQEGARPMRGYYSQLVFGAVNLGDTAEWLAGYGAALTSRATRFPDSSAPSMDADIHDVCSPAKYTRPSGRAMWGRRAKTCPGPSEL